MCEYEILDTTANWDLRGKPSLIRISRNGTIRFSVLAVNKLGLKEGGRLAFMLPKDDNEILYIYESQNGIELKQGTKAKNGVSLYCCGRHHAAKILDHLKIRSGFKTFDITKETTEINGQKCWFVQRDKIHHPIKH